MKLLTEAAKQGQLYLDVVAYMYQQFPDVSANPLTVEPAKIKGIEVLETIKEGRSVYRRK